MKIGASEVGHSGLFSASLFFDILLITVSPLPLPFRCLVPTLLVAILTAGCVTKEAPSALDADEKDRGLLSKLGAWREKQDGSETSTKEKGSVPPASLPVPQKLPIGSVHLVHSAGGFVLIRTSRTAVIPPEAEMATYDERGRPTGKLKLSPERKGAFLVADITQGNPGANDRVVMFSILDEGGQEKFDAAFGEGGEVLE